MVTINITTEENPNYTFEFNQLIKSLNCIKI